MGEDSDDEDTTGTNTNFDIHAAISGVDTTTTEGDQQSFLIPDMDVEKLVVQTKVQNGCGCPHNCYNQFSEDEVYYSRLQMLELEKGERDMLFLGKLMVCGRTASSVSHARKVTATKRQRVTYEYSYDHRVVCKPVFCFIHAISEKVLKNLQVHLKENGPIPRVHGNKGRLPPNTFTFETIEYIVTFILNYAEVYGLPQPAAGRGRADVHQFICLLVRVIMLFIRSTCMLKHVFQQGYKLLSIMLFLAYGTKFYLISSL